jgi:putative peptide zinc metalloprotease protein
MRPDVTSNRQVYQGREYWVVKDPISLKYYRFEEEEFAILQMLDGKLSADQIKRKFDYKYAPQKLTLQELYQFVGMLYRSSLLVSDSPGQGVELKKRRDKNKAQELKGTLQNVLAVKFRGFDPNTILNRLDRCFGWFFSWPAFFCVLLVAISALGLLTTHFEVFQAKLPKFQEFFASSNWFWLFLVMGVTKVIHEFGHGMACKRFGGECHEMGVMLLVMTPCLYCNVSDSWMLPSKWKRAFIAAAGMYFELIIASVAVFVWWYSQPGLINQLALNTVFVCSVSTLLFNANPLLRYDGYYILSDLMEVPNLRQKASTVLSRTASNWCLGIKSRVDPFLPTRKKWLFIVYSISAVIYRWFITIMIFWFLYQLLEPYGLKIIGQLIALTAIWGLLGMPLIKLYKFFTVPGRMQSVKTSRVVISSIVIGVCLFAVMLIPLPHYVRCSFYVQPSEVQNVFVETPGVLTQIHAFPNTMVRKGQPIVSLDNEELDYQLITMEREAWDAEVSYQTAQKAAKLDSTLKAEENAAYTAWVAAVDKFNLRFEDIDLEIGSVAVRANADGLLIPPPVKNKPEESKGELPSWHGVPLEAKNQGAYLEQRTLLGQIVPPDAAMEAVLAIEQEDIEFIRTDQKVKLWVKQLAGRTLNSKTQLISPVKMEVVPKALASRHGGAVMTSANAEGQDQPSNTTYQVSVPVERIPTLLSGSTGKAKVHVGYQTVGEKLWRTACRTFRFEL